MKSGGFGGDGWESGNTGPATLAGVVDGFLVSECFVTRKTAACRLRRDDESN
jgi:hypothetical protein